MDTTDPKFGSYICRRWYDQPTVPQEQDRGVIQQYVAYLNNKLTTNTNVGQREALDSLLLAQERRLMLTAVDVPYAASVQDGQTCPVRTRQADSVHRRVLGLILGVGLGAALSFYSGRTRLRSKLWTQS